MVGLDDQTDYLYGENVADVLLGKGGSDTLEGNDGDDVLVGGTGDDTLEGGVGEDQYRFFAGDSSGRRGDRIQSDLDGGGLYFDDIKRLADFSFSNEDGGFSLSANNDKVTILPGQGIYKLYYGVEETLAGELYIDTANNDGSITGSDGQDFLVGLEGTDTLQGGAGEDIYMFSFGDGTDRIESDSRGDEESEKLLFASVTDSQNFAINRNAVGDVTVAVASDGVTIDNNNAYENGRYKIYYKGSEGPYGTLLGSLYVGVEGQANQLVGSDEKNIVVGTSGNDQILGKEGDDILEGGDGEDTLHGGTGNDILQGGVGADTLYGGAGDDVYRFDAGDGFDVIVDHDTTGNNKVIFRSPDGSPYDSVWDFDYTRGTYDALDTDNPFTESSSGDDLKIEVEQNTVYIVDYYGEDVFTIYNAAFGSTEDGAIVQSPSELG